MNIDWIGLQKLEPRTLTQTIRRLVALDASSPQQMSTWICARGTGVHVQVRSGGRQLIVRRHAESVGKALEAAVGAVEGWFGEASAIHPHAAFSDPL